MKINAPLPHITENGMKNTGRGLTRIDYDEKLYIG